MSKIFTFLFGNFSLGSFRNFLDHAHLAPKHHPKKCLYPLSLLPVEIFQLIALWKAPKTSIVNPSTWYVRKSLDYQTFCGYQDDLHGNCPIAFWLTHIDIFQVKSKEFQSFMDDLAVKSSWTFPKMMKKITSTLSISISVFTWKKILNILTFFL